MDYFESAHILGTKAERTLIDLTVNVIRSGRKQSIDEMETRTVAINSDSNNSVTSKLLILMQSWDGRP